jgi:SAM-dependent methyltransferase
MECEAMVDSRRRRDEGFHVRATRLGSRKPDVRFEPTPRHIVRAMLELASVTPRDVVYDLGSGDGRVVISAAREFGARAVGIENDPERVDEAERRAQEAGVAGKVRFLRQDLFESDVRPATVVTLFLLEEANLLLRPRLRRELAPGTRIVSYIHEMGDWKPAKARYTVDRLGWYHRLYLWEIPATATVTEPSPTAPAT